MINAFASIAKIKYDPHRAQMSKRTAWWCVAEVDTEITRYCRWWLQRERHIYLQEPAWNAHSSIVRGEKPFPQYIGMWKKFDKKTVEFNWNHFDIHSQEDKVNGGMFYWINVECPQFDQIRASLGLRTGFKYHITIGRTYEYQARKTST